LSTLETPTAVSRRPFSGRRLRFGDLILQLIAGAATLLVLVTVGAIVYKLVEGAWPSMSQFGLGFLDHVVWDNSKNTFAAGGYIFGTVVVGFGSLFLATPLALGIALYLSELAPSWVRGLVTPLVETLAAIPSVIMGLWGLLILAPFLKDDVDPALHSAFGFIPLFGTATTGQNLFTAIVVLTVMILPIISSISRELFLGVPAELKEAALGLGLTRWEMVKGVVFPYARGGVAAAMILGLGRAVGEAIAVMLVAGGVQTTGGISWNIFNTGDTLAAKIASVFNGGTASTFERPSLFYLAVILLVFSLVVNIAAQVIIRRSARKLGMVR
jgi:phosphate transport system permease protein